MKLFRYVLFSFEVFLCYFIQTIPGLTLEVFGGRPVILIPVALSIAMFEEEIPAIIFGAVCGLLTDFGYIGAVGCYGIVLSVMCWLISIMTGNYIRKNLLTALIIGGICIPAAIFIQFFLFYLFMGYDHAGDYFLNHYLSRIFYTFIYTFLFYYLNEFISRKMKSKEKYSRFLKK